MGPHGQTLLGVSACYSLDLEAPEIHEGDLAVVFRQEGDGRGITGIPRNAKNGVGVGVLEDSGVLIDRSSRDERTSHSPQIKQPNRPIFAAGNEGVAVVGREGNVVHLLAVCFYLRNGLLDLLLTQHEQRYVNIPDGANGIETRRSQNIRVECVPVKRRHRTTPIWRIVLAVSITNKHHLIQNGVHDWQAGVTVESEDSDIVPRKGKHVGVIAVRIWSPHDFRRRIDRIDFMQLLDLGAPLVKLQNLHNQGHHSAATCILFV